jgi:hypothetical protein
MLVIVLIVRSYCAGKDGAGGKDGYQGHKSVCCQHFDMCGKTKALDDLWIGFGYGRTRW